MSDGDRAPTATASWLRPVEAAAALGVSPEAIRARIRRGTLESRAGNDGRVRVLVTLPERSAIATPNGGDRTAVTTRPGGDATTEHGSDRAAEDELAQLRDALAEERVARARLEGELAAEQRRNGELVATLTAALAKAEARADRLEAALAEARRPWLAKVIDGLRRKG